MTLAKLLAALPVKETRELRPGKVMGIKVDSRQVEPGDVFVALPGTRNDGRMFATDALSRGALACVVEAVPVEGPCIVVPDARRALALLASEFYGHPARNLWMCGVTGTNGKTSTAHLLRSVCESCWGKVGLVGTVGHGVGSELEEAQHTTPDPVTLQRLLKSFLDQGCRGVVMEVSSHGVRQQRTRGVDFEVGILTNVTRDHLDYHRSLADYIGAKEEFCFSLVEGGREKEPGLLVYNGDDPVAREIGGRFPGRKVSVGLGAETDVRAESVRANRDGTAFILHLPGVDAMPVKLQLLGRFNVHNALLAAAAANSLGLGPQGIKQGLEALARVPGRFEALGGGELPLVVVDYSHTPDSLEQALEFCRALGPQRLITVFGCGGDRDRGKRPLMGRIARKLSDVCYVTSDNPRSEDPRAIIDEILTGMDAGGVEVVVEVDRAAAIAGAIARASRGDLVAICGKGHEDYQIVGSEKRHFDDREEARKALARWRSAERS